MNGKLILSIFPGIDLLGKGFEAEGFTVVRGPDLIWGGDVRAFHVPPGAFDGVIGGSPCQDFSKARRAPPTGYGLAMLEEFKRVVVEADPTWFLLENVPGVPDVTVQGFRCQRFTLNARDCGSAQNRLRTFQWGHKDGRLLVLERSSSVTDLEPCCMASEGKRSHRRAWSDFCQLQGLPADFDIPGLSRAAKYRAVGNGVPIPMASVIARSIANLDVSQNGQLCECQCGRLVQGRQRLATPACRKRMERARKESEARGLEASAQAQAMRCDPYGINLLNIN